LKIVSMSIQQQTKDAILAFIREHEGKIEKLPSEQEFAKLLGVSRATVREAIKVLVSENIVYSKHGVGTFIVKGTSQLSTSMNILESWTTIISKHGFAPGTQDVIIEIREADEKVAEKLGIHVGDNVVYLERLRTADGKPIVFVIDYAKYHEGMIQRYKETLPESFLAFIEDYTNSYLDHVICRIQPVSATGEIQRKLRQVDSHPLLFLEQVHCTQYGDPFFYSESYVISEMLQFNIIRKKPT